MLAAVHPCLYVCVPAATETTLRNRHILRDQSPLYFPVQKLMSSITYIAFPFTLTALSHLATHLKALLIVCFNATVAAACQTNASQCTCRSLTMKVWFDVPIAGLEKVV